MVVVVLVSFVLSGRHRSASLSLLVYVCVCVCVCVCVRAIPRLVLIMAFLEAVVIVGCSHIYVQKITFIQIIKWCFICVL